MQRGPNHQWSGSGAGPATTAGLSAQWRTIRQQRLRVSPFPPEPESAVWLRSPSSSIAISRPRSRSPVAKDLHCLSSLPRRRAAVCPSSNGNGSHHLSSPRARLWARVPRGDHPIVAHPPEASDVNGSTGDQHPLTRPGKGARSPGGDLDRGQACPRPGWPLGASSWRRA